MSRLLKLVSWNVNGIRSVLRQGFLETVRKHRPDILCLQEIKAPSQTSAKKTIRNTVSGTLAEPVEVHLPGYFQYWNPADRPGYSGTAVFTKIKPLYVKNGLGIPKHDTEGRVMTLEYPRFFLVNVYVPNSKRGLERLPYRTQEWDVDFLKYLKALEKKKLVVFCGDLNVAHREIDLTNPKSNIHNHGFTPEERSGFDNIVKAGFIDTFRELIKEGGHYTWWSQLSNCRERNIGWRIDYFCISASLHPSLKDAFILNEVRGSDHCPVGILLK